MSAVITLPSGATPLAPPLRARIAAALDESKVRIPSFLAEQIRRHQQYTAACAAKEAGLIEVAGLVEKVKTEAQEKDWSQRELSKHTGLPPRSWRRLCAGQVNLSIWLPKLRAAVAQLSTHDSLPTT